MGKGSSILAVIVIIVIVAVALGLHLPFLPSGETQGPQGDYVGIGMTIHFTDGTTEVIHPQQANPLLPLTVYLDDNPISEIDYDVFCQLSWTGDLSSVTYNTDLDIVDTEHLLIKQDSRSNYGYTPSQGEWVHTLGLSVTAQEIEAWADQHPTMFVGVNGEATVSIDALFTNGDHITKSGTAKGGVLCGVSLNDVTAMSVDINVTPIF